ncbi:MAG: O-antigen ligase family protein [Terracidiphilus sp.]
MPDASIGMSRLWPPILPAIAGFYFAARLCLTFLFFQSDPKLGAYANFALHFVLFAVVFLYSFGPPAVALHPIAQSAPLRWAIGFLCMGACSLTWSVTVSKPIAFAYWCELAAEVFIVVCLLQAREVRTVSTAVLQGYVLGALFIAAVEWLSPTMYDLRPGNDDFFSPNAIGFTCAFAVFLIQIACRSSFLWRVVAAVLAVSLLRSLSKTTIVAFVAAQALLLIMDYSRSWITRFLLALSALLVVWTFSGLLENYYEVYTHLGNQSETLSGRLGIWAFVLERSVQEPWLGHGFHSFRNVIPPFGSFEAWHAHNELLQQFYTYGVVGVILVACLYISLLRQFRSVADPALKARLLALWVFIVIRGLADTENFDLSLPLWSVAVISVMLAHAPARAIGVGLKRNGSPFISGSLTEECAP